ncbi:hypothetical protein [Algoriphagus machipongonensis]|uniref:BNR repeat protein n=1 Tax=Algoriphagus machipongonensis TaxID=388413 RepID=A3HYL4_9BACT|nr:hypothetical protein [Algoriphagus machipongonensis]EAZ80350.1 BNR repeat protein [Algoriphagus machipongonensis]
MKLHKSFHLGFILAVLFSCAESKKEDASLKAIPFPDTEQTSLPYLFTGSDGPVISWVKKLNDSTTELRYSQLTDNQWQVPKKITQGSDWFINWADFPSITENKGHLMTHFLQKSSRGTYSYDVKLNLLKNNDSSWKINLPLHTDSTFTEHGFVSAVPYSTDSFFITWLDGRNTGMSEGHDHDEHGGGAMSIRAATVHLDGSITDEVELDSRTCDCCQTTTAITENGPIVVYRDRSDSEVRDIYITRLVDGHWATPKPVHSDGWEINGCPVNGPKVDAKGKTVVVAWFTGVNNEPKVKVAFSRNAGESFSAPIQVSGSDALGRVDVALLDDHSAILTWMETEGEETYFKAAKVTDGGMGNPIQITPIDPARKSGFPQMEIFKENIYFAWTEVIGDQNQVKTASLAKTAF